jgi:pimeloyl-ACP methyl ester carboxylesterase
MLRRTLRGANATALPEHELQEIYRQLDFGTQRAILKLYRSVKPGTLAAAGERLGEIDSPALIVWGERDPYIPSRAAAQYAGALGGESELALLADAGHWPWLDRPDVVDTVARFLARN